MDEEAAYVWYPQWAFLYCIRLRVSWLVCVLNTELLSSIPLECLSMIPAMSPTWSLILHWVLWCTHVWYLCDLDVPVWLASASLRNVTLCFLLIGHCVCFLGSRLTFLFLWFYNILDFYSYENRVFMHPYSSPCFFWGLVYMYLPRHWKKSIFCFPSFIRALVWHLVISFSHITEYIFRDSPLLYNFGTTHLHDPLEIYSTQMVM